MEVFGEYSSPTGFHGSPFVRATPTQIIDGDSLQRFEEFKTRLRRVGIESSSGSLVSKRRSVLSHTKTIEDLFLEEQANECQISIVDGCAVQRSEIVQVYLLAEVNRERCCLIEVDEFDLMSGVQRSLRRPPEKRLRNGETWREAMQVALEELVGIDRPMQQQFLQIDEESYYFHEEKGKSIECPGLLTETKIHEISVRCLQEGLRPPTRVPTQQEMDDGEELLAPLDIVGLPSGREFVTRQDTTEGRIRLRVWCWKNRQYQKNSRLVAFSRYLESYGVDLSSYAKRENKSLFQLFVEVKEDKESYLQEVVATSSEGPKLQRVVDLLQIKVIADVLNRKRVLSATEQMLDDGRVRHVNELVCHKLKPNEDWSQTMVEVIKSKLGLDEEVQARCLRLAEDGDGNEYREEVQNSKGYPGIESVYRIRTVTQMVVDPLSPELVRIGLPRGNDFVTKEGDMGVQKGGRVNVWTWRLLIEEDGPQVFTGTALEELNRALHDAEEMILRTSLDHQIIDLGLADNLTAALQKIKFCTERSANIDATLSHVDVKSMMQKYRGAKKESKTACGIADFITANFTRARTQGSLIVETPHADRRPSRALEFTHSATLERWGSATPVVEHIRSNEDSADLDIFELQEMSKMRVIQTYGEYALVPLCRITMQCEPETSRRFLDQVSSLYFDNKYHNAAHAVQVTHSGLWMTRNLGLEDIQSDLAQAAFIISALCHDVKHFGRNNAFVINSEHSVALLYNNAKVLENMHAATTFELLQAPVNYNTNVLSKVTREDRQDLRSQIIEHILATDMSEHFEAISKFRVRMESHDFSIESEADRRFVAKMIMKAGDIGHSSLPWLLHLKWSQLVVAEFLEQGDDESQLGLPVSALCDRKKMGDVGKSQKGFLEFVCLPLLEVLDMSYLKIRLREEDLHETPDKLDSGHRIVVIKDARTKGRTGVILNPDYQGSIQVEMDLEDEKGKIKSYRHSDLRIIKDDESWESPVRSTWIDVLKKNTSLWIEDKVAVAKIQSELTI